jgi:hypothetical protein
MKSTRISRILSLFPADLEITVIDADMIYYRTKSVIMPTAIIMNNEERKMYEYAITLQPDSKQTP